MTKGTVSFAALDARKASEKPFKFPFKLDGKDTGVIFHVIGGQAKVVKDAVAKLINEQRQDEALALIAAKSEAKADEPVFRPFEEDVAFANNNAAIRLVGWEGLDTDYTPELAVELCTMNDDARIQVLTESAKISNFMKLSPPA